MSTEPHNTLLNETALWGSPRMGDGEFIVAVRMRIEARRRGASTWLPLPKLALVSGLSLMLLAALWLPGMWNRVPVGVGTDAGLTMSLEEMAESDISPQELAAYLDLSLTEDLELDEATDYSVETVSTEELLALEESDFDLVLAELEETNFF